MTNSKIKVAVLGAGKIGSHHARILGSLPEAQLIGVCDPNYWRAQMAKKSFISRKEVAPNTPWFLWMKAMRKSSPYAAMPD